MSKRPTIRVAQELSWVCCARRSDDTEARHSQGEQATARERRQAGSCRPAMMDVTNLAGELRHLIETGEPDPCQLGSPVGRDKGRNAFRKAMPRQGAKKSGVPPRIPRVPSRLAGRCRKALRK